LAEGPYGSFTAARRRRRKVLLIAGGVGITPLRALFETLPAQPGDVTLLYRVNKQDDLLLRDELDDIADQRGSRVHYVIGPPRLVAWRSFKAHVQPTGAVLPTAAVPQGGASAGGGGATPSSSSQTPTRTVVGDAVNTPYGIVQVKAKLSGTKIVDVSYVQLTS